MAADSNTAGRKFDNVEMVSICAKKVDKGTCNQALLMEVAGLRGVGVF